MSYQYFYETGGKYTTATWNNNTNSTIGKWIISSPVGTKKEIANASQNGRYNIGNQSFFILASGLQQNIVSAKFKFFSNYTLTGINNGESFSFLSNYSWHGGYRKVSFNNIPVLGTFLGEELYGTESSIFEITHQGSDAINLTLNAGNQGSFLIDSNAYNKAYNFNLMITSKTNDIYNYQLNVSASDSNFLTPIFSTSILTNLLINTLAFSASGNNSDDLIVNQNNYGIFFNDISLEKLVQSSSSSSSVVPSSSSSSVVPSSSSSSVVPSSSSSSVVPSSSSSHSDNLNVGELSQCLSTPSNFLFTSREIIDFHAAVNSHFDTFKRNIIIHKEPKKNILNQNSYNLLGYYENPEAEITYVTENKCFPAIIKYDPGAKDLEGIIDLTTKTYKQIVKIKVKSDAKDYINNGLTEKITFDDKTFKVISPEIPRNYQGLKYYCFYLELVS